MKKLYILLLLISPLFSGAITNALKLKITGNNFNDEIAIRFLPGATPQFDNVYDAWKLFSSNTNVPQLYTRCAPGQDLSINALPLTSIDTIVEVLTVINVAGTYTFTATEAGLFQRGVCIRLEDKLTGSFYDLRSGGSFSFTLPVTPYNSADRFRVHFKIPIKSLVTNASCYGTTDGAVILSGSGWAYSLQNINHSVIQSSSNISSSDTAKNLTSGIYIITETTSIGCVSSDTIRITQPSQIIAGYNTTDTILYLNNTGTVNLTNTSQNANNYTWNFGDNSGTSSVVNPSHTYTATGTYSLTLKAAAGNCFNQTNKIIRVYSSPAGIAEHGIQEDMSIGFSGTKVRIQNNSGINFSVNAGVFNMLGQEISSLTGNGSNFYEINLNAIPNATYIVRAVSGNTVVSKKIIIQEMP